MHRTTPRPARAAPRGDADVWWAARTAELDAAIATADSADANRLITAAHRRLSSLLARRLGTDSGANFHTWAVWGSVEAGITIAGRRSRMIILRVAGAIAVAVAVVAVIAGQAAATVGGEATAAGALALGAGSLALARAQRHISNGNRTVLDDIGRVTLAFVERFADATAADPAELRQFVAGLLHGDTDRHLLASAFSAYHEAIFEPDRRRRQQLVFAGNCMAVWHEHVRLQRHIEGAMPVGLRRFLTTRLLDFRVGSEQFDVARDLTCSDRSPYPDSLTELTEARAAEIATAMRCRDHRGVALDGTAAVDWTCFAQRMNYIVELFRSRHTAAAVFAEPSAAAARQRCAWPRAVTAP